MSRFAIRFAFALAALSVTAFAGVPATQPDFSRQTESVTVPFAKPVDWDKMTSMRVRVSLNGGPPTTFQVDTGSVGIIVGASELPDIDPNAPAGSITYTSSGITLEGVWTPTTVTFLDVVDAQGNHPTARVPVLAAKERKVNDKDAVNGGFGKPSTDPKVYMFGIGFGRGKEAHPERNAFLNLMAMDAGTMRRGYAITRDGFTLGLTEKSVGGGYVYQKLKERVLPDEVAKAKPGLKDFENARGQVVVNGKPEPEAAVLLDTGLTNMIIGRPDQPVTLMPLADNTPITVKLQGGALEYSFVTGERKTPQAPTKTTFVKRPDAPTLNTGRNVLHLFDYLYDADGGYLGLRPVVK